MTERGGVLGEKKPLTSRLPRAKGIPCRMKNAKIMIRTPKLDGAPDSD